MKKVISLLVALSGFLCITYFCATWSEKFDVAGYERIYKNTADIFVQYEGNEVVPFKYNETISLLKSAGIDVYGIVPRSSRYSIFFNFTGNKLIWKDFLMEIEYYKDGTAYATQKYSLACVDPQYLHEICLDRVPYIDSVRIKSLSYFVVPPDELLYRSRLYKCGDAFLNKNVFLNVKRIASNHIDMRWLVRKNCKCTILIHDSNGDIIDTIDLANGVSHRNNYTDFGIKYYSVIIRSS